MPLNNAQSNSLEVVGILNSSFFSKDGCRTHLLYLITAEKSDGYLFVGKKLNNCNEESVQKRPPPLKQPELPLFLIFRGKDGLP
ncbi:hypothetical protein CEXT_515181 [Caerostris extrusa]|uniref:Uncharacterized protein n=1 Tax=Caerostris extrusa TaxID=172846 RepID=A0AAV4MJN0_CAEEX|nr:hypothetical protein CEXT_515181 [Caerostris extrusa]